jgi:hypothetical protein
MFNSQFSILNPGRGLDRGIVPGLRIENWELNIDQIPISLTLLVQKLTMRKPYSRIALETRIQ